MKPETFEIMEKTVEPVLVASIRFKGKYSDCSNAFSRLGRSLGRRIAGHFFNLYYDEGYKENDADIESCVPIRQPKEVEGITIRTVPGGRCLSLLHRGPYDEVGPSYEKIMAYAQEKNLTLQGPAREIYLKGPGMFFKGNPKKYLTEIQIPLAEK